MDMDEDDFERRYDCDRCGDTGWAGDRPCYKCDAHDLREPSTLAGTPPGGEAEGSNPERRTVR